MALSLAQVFGRFAPAYQQQHGQTMLPSHRRAIDDILVCRTPVLGGHLWYCQECGQEVYVYHGCRNRNCPDCHQSQTLSWLQERQAELWDCPYFHLTATIPEALRTLFRGQQKTMYDLLMRLSAQCILELSANPKHLGAMPGILAVLHTWTGKLDYHPHVHCLVTGGGVSADQASWVPTRPGFLLPVRMLSRHLRHLFQQALQKQHPELYAQAPKALWQQEWVVHCIPWGHGPDGVLEYLAPLCPPHRHHLAAAAGDGPAERELPVQGPQSRPHADLLPGGPGVPAPLLPAHPAPGVSQGPLLRPVESQAAGIGRASAAAAEPATAPVAGRPRGRLRYAGGSRCRG